MSSETLQGIGPKLAAAREAKGLSTAEVASKLRLGVRQVEALEADAFDRLPGEVFVRGFVRNYARFLELDAEELLPSQEVAVAEQLTVPSTNVRFQPSPLQRWLLLPLGSAVLFFALVALLYAWLSSGEQAVLEQPALEVHQPLATPPAAQAATEAQATTVAGEDAQPQDAASATAPSADAAPKAEPPAAPANKPSIVDAAKPIVPPLAANAPAPVNAAQAAAPAPRKTLPEAAKPIAPALTKPVVPAMEPPKATAPLAPKAPAVPAPLAVAPAANAAKPVPQAPAVVAPTAEPVKPVDSHKLLFQPSEDSWVQVVDGGGQRFSKLIRAGSSEVLSGTPPFRMVIGNAANMRLSHDGKAIDLKPFIGEKVARLKLSDEGASKMTPPASPNP